LQDGPTGNAVFAAVQYEYEAGVVAYMGTQAYYDEASNSEMYEVGVR
jgi:hypothetical protein